jgi:hypothetical protein
MMRPRILITVALVLAMPSLAPAFERDSHYNLRFALSLAACFDWEESHLIASGDWGMDENRATYAEMNPIQRKNKIQWHAFGHHDQRFHELWQRSREETDLEYRLVKLGQFMHFLEDWESHAGYGVRMGHARATFAGHDPDSLGSSKAKNRRMVQSALEHLLLSCEDLGRLDSDVDEILVRMMKTIDEDGVLEDLFEASDPAWKKGKLGGHRQQAAEIFAVNKTRVEELIQRYVQPIPQKNIPEQFEPGHPERGLPPSLGLAFDQDGEILDVPDTVDEVTAAYAAAAHLAPDLSVSLTKAQARKKGWRVQVEVANHGEEGVSGGTLEVVVIDGAEESVLAKKSEPLPALAAGESVELALHLPSIGRARKDAIFGAYIRVQEDDNGMDDIDWLMSQEVAEELPEIPVIDDLDDSGDEGPIEMVRFLGRPKLILVENSGCLVLTAVTAEGDTTEKLGEASFGLISADGDRMQILRRIPPLWSALSTEDGRVAGKLIACFQPGPEECKVWWSMENPRLMVEISVLDDGVEPVHEIIPIEPEMHRTALAVCDPFGTFIDMHDGSPGSR